MIDDLRAVMHKEWRELLRLRGRIRATIIWMVALLGVFGVLFPLQSRGMLVYLGLGTVFSFWVPTILVTPVVADSFAGERERHTLETLLASRLSTAAILLGKLAVALLYGLVVMVALILVSHVTAWYALPARYRADFPRPGYAGWLVVTSVVAYLLVCLFAVIGLVISVRAPTVRQAQQTLGLLVAVLPSVLWLAWLRLDDLAQRALVTALGGPVAPYYLGAAAVLATAGGLVVALRRFQRCRLLTWSG